MNTENQLEEEQGTCLHAQGGKATNTNKYQNRKGRQMEESTEESTAEAKSESISPICDPLKRRHYLQC